MSKKPQAAPDQDGEFDPEELQAVLDEMMDEDPGYFIDQDAEHNLDIARRKLRRRRRLDGLCALADIEYTKREKYKKTIRTLIEDTFEGTLFGVMVPSEVIDAAMIAAAKKVRAAHGAIAALTQEQLYELAVMLMHSAEGTWIWDGLEQASSKVDFDPSLDFSKAERERKAKILLDLMSVLSTAFIKLTDRKPEPRTNRQSGRLKGDVPGQRFRRFVRALWTETNKAGGWLSVSRPSPGAVKGGMPEALGLLAPDLPNGLIPKPLTAAILEEIQSGVQVKPFPRSHSRERSRIKKSRP